MFDSHCHLTDLNDPHEAVREARLAGVSGILTCGYHRASNLAVCSLARQDTSLSFALGLHPWFANEPVEPVLELIRTERPTAVGEIGLDLWNRPPRCPIDRQMHVLQKQLQLAQQLGLNVSMHSLKALHLLVPIIREFPDVKGILHAFSGSYEQAQPFVEHGYLIGVSGAVTRPKAVRIRKCIQKLPLSQLALETDAPAIPMVDVAPMQVRPKHLTLVRDALADLHQVSPQIVMQITDANVRRVFNLPLTGATS